MAAKVIDMADSAGKKKQEDLAAQAQAARNAAINAAMQNNAAEQNKAASSGTANNTNIGNAAVTGALAGALATLNKNGNAGGNNGDNGKGETGGNGGGGTGAAAAPSVQAAAQGSVQTQTPAAAKTADVTYNRPEMSPYKESQQVLDAYAAMQAAQNGQPGAYTPSQAVLDAQAALQNLQSTKPQGYSSKYQPQLDALLQQIMNPGEFKYEFNADNLFKMYADEYTQRGKQASLDAMGQAAALTGGYGNSYAQQVGNQAYDQNLTQLYDRGMELYDKAYQKYLDDQNRIYNQYGLLNDAENTAYDRYRDTVGDYNNELNYLTDFYNNEKTFDYGKYSDDYNRWAENRSYATDLYNQLSNTDYARYADAVNLAEQQYQYDTNLKENVRQFNESLDWDKMSQEQKYAAQYAMDILANGQMPTAEMLQAAGLSAADAQKLMAQIVAAGGGGSTGGNKELYIQGSDGKYYKTDSNGKVITDKNGKPTGVTEDKLPANAGYIQNPGTDAINLLSASKTASEKYQAGNAYKNVADLINMYYGDDKKKKGN
ncbi:MAG: hypothetical protein J6Y48_00370 [Clostridia bacterium]|nr:hypothetical protein [Clostridia bacterium]